MLCYRFFKKAYSPNPSTWDQAPLWEKKWQKTERKGKKILRVKVAERYTRHPFPSPFPRLPLGSFRSPIFSAVTVIMASPRFGNPGIPKTLVAWAPFSSITLAIRVRIAQSAGMPISLWLFRAEKRNEHARTFSPRSPGRVWKKWRDFKYFIA